MTLTGFNSCSRLTLSHFDFKSVKIVTTSEFHEKQLEATQKCQKPGLGPIISSTCLPEHEVVRAEQLAERSGTNAIHGACNNIWQSEAIKTATHKPQSLFRIWLPRMLAEFTPMRHQFHSIPTSNMCGCSAESQCPMSAEMYLLKTS